MKALKKILVGGALALTLATPLLTPNPAEAWVGRGGWHAGWGWHGGWGWRGGVYVGGPALVVGPGYYGPAYYGGYYRPGYHWVRPYYTPYRVYVPGHWGY